MGQVYCKYHPQRSARYVCSRCQAHFCNSCISRDTSGELELICPLCRVRLDDVLSDQVIPPFWTRLPYFFLFPLRPKVFGLILVLGLLSFAIGFKSFFGLLFLLVAFVVLFKYAYQVMNHLADGNKDAPSPVDLFSGDLGPALKQFGVFFILTIPSIPLARYGGELGGALGALLFSALLPASVMVLATTESVWDAVNPGNLYNTIRAMGGSYLALGGVLFLLSGGVNAAQDFLFAHASGDFGRLMEQAADDPRSVDPATLARAREAFMERLANIVLPVLVALRSYVMLVAFAMMGYVLYQFHSKLGLAVEVDFDGEDAAKDHPLLGDVEVLIREGRLDDAAKLLRERVIAHENDLKLRDRFHRVLVALGDRSRITGHGAEYISLLLKSANGAKAAEVYSDCRKADPSFAVDSHDEVLPLAKAMFQIGRHAELVMLANGFHRLAPRHPDIPELYFLMARSLSELKRDAQARPLLQSLLKSYSGHPLAPEMKRCLHALDRMAEVGR